MHGPLNKKSLNQIKRLIERDGDLCHYCESEMSMTPDRKDSLTRDHIVPRSLGGMATVENFVLACGDCNNRRGNDIYYCDCTYCVSVVDMFFTNFKLVV